MGKLYEALDERLVGFIGRQKLFFVALPEDVVKLRQQVTSKNGTTEQAILSFQQDNLKQLVENATAAAHRRSKELAAELTGEN